MESEGYDLARAAQKGNQRAAEQLIETFYVRVYSFLRRRAGKEEDAADLCQKTFARVWQALPGFAGRSSVNSWIHAIAYHVYVDWRRGLRPAECRPDEWWEAQAGGFPQPDHAAQTRDLRAMLWADVELLEENARSAVHLHYFQGLSLRETAEVLGIAESTVKYQLRKAISLLQQKLVEEPSATVP
jgi:RNA polymerase sigma-70 factor (ECF subfamily)